MLGRGTTGLREWCHEDRGRPGGLGELSKVGGLEMKSASITGWDDRTKMHEFLAVRVVNGHYKVKRIKDQATA